MKQLEELIDYIIEYINNKDENLKEEILLYLNNIIIAISEGIVSEELVNIYQMIENDELEDVLSELEMMNSEVE